MLSHNEIMQTIQMIDQQHLDVRTITMGISLLSCAHSNPGKACTRIYDKITRCAEKLVATGEEIEKEFGIPIVNKRIPSPPSPWWQPPRRRRTTSPSPGPWTGRRRSAE